MPPSGQAGGQELRNPCALGHHQSPGRGGQGGWSRCLCPHARGQHGARGLPPRAQDPGLAPCHLSCRGCCGHSPGRPAAESGARSRTGLLGRQEHGGMPRHGEDQPPLPSAQSSLSRARGPRPPACARPPAAGLPAPGPSCPRPQNTKAPVGAREQTGITRLGVGVAVCPWPEHLGGLRASTPGRGGTCRKWRLAWA